MSVLHPVGVAMRRMTMPRSARVRVGPSVVVRVRAVIVKVHERTLDGQQATGCSQNRSGVVKTAGYE